MATVCLKKPIEATNDSAEDESAVDDSETSESKADESAESTDESAESGASACVDSCNDENGAVEMKVTLKNHKGTYEGIDENGKGTFGADQLTKKVEEDFLIMEKVFGSDECTKTEVQGTEICSDVGEKIIAQCKYPLEEQTVKTEDGFAVAGQNNEVEADNVSQAIGTLKYTMEVDNDKNIGQEISFKLTPATPGLVYATIKSCDVILGSRKLTIIGGSETAGCTEAILGVAALTENFSSDNVIEGKWTAFKWSTTSENSVESQTLECTIGFSETPSPVAVEDCPADN